MKESQAFQTNFVSSPMTGKKPKRFNKLNDYLFLFLIILVALSVGFFVGDYYSAKTVHLEEVVSTEQNTDQGEDIGGNINEKRIELIKELVKRTPASQTPNFEWLIYYPKCKAVKDHFVGEIFYAIYYPSNWKVNEDAVSRDMKNDKQDDYECTIMFGYPVVGSRQSNADGQISEIRITAYYVDDATTSAKEYITQRYNKDKEALKKLNMGMAFSVEEVDLGDDIDAVKVITSHLSIKDFDWVNQKFPVINGNYRIVIKDGNRVFEISLSSFGLHSQNLSTFKDFINKLMFGEGR